MSRENKKQLVRHKSDGSTDMSTIVVTPSGNYSQVGDYGNNEDLIPENASESIDVSSRRVNDEDAQRGARYFNNAMSRSSAYIAPMFIGSMPLVGPLFNLGLTGKYLSDQSGLSDAVDRGGQLWKAEWQKYDSTEIKTLSDLWDNARKLYKTEGKATDAFLSELENFEAFKPFADDIKSSPDKMQKIEKAMDLGMNIATIMPLLYKPMSGIKGNLTSELQMKHTYQGKPFYFNYRDTGKYIGSRLKWGYLDGKIKYSPTSANTPKGPISKRFDSWIHVPTSLEEALGGNMSLKSMPGYKRAMDAFDPSSFTTQILSRLNNNGGKSTLRYPNLMKWLQKMYNNRSSSRMPSEYFDELMKEAAIERAKAYNVLYPTNDGITSQFSKIADRVADNGIIVGDYALAQMNPGQYIKNASFDIITTTKRYPKLLESLGVPNQELHQGVNVIDNGGQQYTIRVLGSNGGYVHNLYAFSNPRQYWQFANRLADRAVGEHNKGVLNGDVKEFKTFEQPIPISEEELFDTYLNNKQLQDDYVKSQYLFGITDKDGLISGYLMKDPNLERIFNKKQIMLTGKPFDNWQFNSNSPSFKSFLNSLGVDLESTTPMERKNLYLKSRLSLSNPLRVVKLEPDKIISGDYLSDAVGTNVTANNAYTIDHSAGNTLYQASRGGVHGQFLSNALMPQRKMRYVQVLDNILKTNQGRLPQEVMDRFVKFSDMMKEAKTTNQMQSIMRQANNYAAHNHLYGFIGGRYNFLDDENNPNPLFFGKFRSGSYGLPIFTSASASGKDAFPVLQTGVIPFKQNSARVLDFKEKQKINKFVATYGDEDYFNIKHHISNHKYPLRLNEFNTYLGIPSKRFDWQTLLDYNIISADDVPSVFKDPKGNLMVPDVNQLPFSQTHLNLENIKGVPKDVFRELLVNNLDKINTFNPFQKIYYNKLIKDYKLPYAKIPYTLDDYADFMDGDIQQSGKIKLLP